MPVIVIILVVGIIIVSTIGVMQLIRSNREFHIEYEIVKKELEKCTSHSESLFLIVPLAAMGWHRSHLEKLNRLFGYIEGKFNSPINNI